MHNSIEWLEGGVNAAPEERATLANLRLFIAEQNVCLHLDNNEYFEDLTLPLYSLADGLALDWWRLFGGRDRDFSLSKYRMGTAAPDVRFQFDGAAFEISALQKIYRNPDVRFWGGSSEVLTRTEAEAAISAFIENVLNRLEARGVAGTSAALRWSRVQASRRDMEEQIFCEAAGALDVDPYDVDDTSASLIEVASTFFSGEALLEFLGGLRGRKEWAPRVIDWLSRTGRRQKYQARLPHLRDAVAQSEIQIQDERAWALGYKKARVARAKLDIKPTKEIESFAWLADRLGAPSFRLAPQVDGLVALREDHDDGIYVHLRRQGEDGAAATGHNFAFARAVGDAFCFPHSERSIVNELRYAHKQATGRAFAAEFLAPVNAVLALRAKGRDITNIAAHYVVAPTVIERQIENADRIREVCGS